VVRVINTHGEQVVDTSDPDWLAKLLATPQS